MRPFKAAFSLDGTEISAVFTVLFLVLWDSIDMNTTML